MKKKHPEHVNHERWLVSYADFITLLFAFFVIMYAISQADLTKFRQVSQSIKKAFSAAGPAGMLDLGGASGGTTVNPFESSESIGGRVLDMPAGKTHTAQDRDRELQEVRELLEEALSLEVGVVDPSEKLQLSYDSQGLMVRLSVNDFFQVGESGVREDLRPILDRVGKVLARTKRHVRVEGHVDPGEVAGVKDGSKPWELSAARASWVAQYWIKRFGVDPKRIGVASYAHHRPLSRGTSDWDRSRNRRVEIVILNNQYQ